MLKAGVAAMILPPALAGARKWRALPSGVLTLSGGDIRSQVMLCTVGDFVTYSYTLFDENHAKIMSWKNNNPICIDDLYGQIIIPRQISLNA